MVHDLIEQRGKTGALLVEPNRSAVEAAAAYMADEDAGIGFLYSGWCQAALPHKRLADDEEWQIQGRPVNMLVQPGLRTSNFGRAEKVGVPSRLARSLDHALCPERGPASYPAAKSASAGQ